MQVYNGLLKFYLQFLHSAARRRCSCYRALYALYMSHLKPPLASTAPRRHTFHNPARSTATACAPACACACASHQQARVRRRLRRRVEGIVHSPHTHTTF